MNINILYEDNHLFIVEKPINVPVQEDKSKDIDLLNYLKTFIKERDKKPGNVYLALVHRLDRPVGGVIIFAKTSKAASRLSDQLRRKKIERKYLAVVNGSVKKAKATLVDYIIKDKKKNIVNIVSEHQKDAKKAILHYELLQANKDLSLLQIELETGRPHQIRVQLSGIQHPIFGDQKYGKNKNDIKAQIALWAYEVTFLHPTTKEILTVQSLPKLTKPWNQFSYIKNEA